MLGTVGEAWGGIPSLAEAELRVVTAPLRCSHLPRDTGMQILPRRNTDLARCWVKPSLLQQRPAQAHAQVQPGLSSGGFSGVWA